MAEYKAIHGFTVQNRTSDTKATGIPGASWSSGADLNRGLSVSMQGAGASNNAAIATGGQTGGPPYVIQDKSEQYNGTAWTEVADLNLARSAAAGAVASPSSNTLYFSGGSGPIPSWSATTEAWDNSSWTEVGDLNSARNGAGGIGSSNTSAICISGEIPNNTQTVNVEEYNGSSWTEIANVNDARRYGVGLGTASSGLYVGGDNDPGYAATNELWNGSSWTEVGDMNTGRSLFGTGGTTTDGIVAAGRTPGKTANTEHWNGSTWTEVANLAVARSDTNAGGGVSTSFLIAGGETATAYVASTEEFSAAGITDSIINIGQVYYRSDTGDMKVTLNVLGTGAWASGGGLNNGRTTYQGSSTSGTQTATITFGGYDTASRAYTESYNGTSWTEVNDLNATTASHAGAGTSTAALSFGGMPAVANNESWDGSSWTEVNNLNTGRGNSASFGLQTAAIAAGGRTPSKANVESFNGTSWTEVNDLNTARYMMAGVGRSTTGLVIGGDVAADSGNGSNIVESWNGTSFTEITELNTARWGLSGAGIDNTEAIAFNGYTSSAYKTITEHWNGTAWTEVADMSVARALGASSGTVEAAVAMGGQGTSIDNTTTEEWTVPSTATNTTITD